jgi:SAM-dependent methyltransferase
MNPGQRDFLAAVDPGCVLPGDELKRSIVDIGSGDGAFLEAALRILPGWSTAFGIDPDFACIVKASERFQDDMRVSFIQADALRVPLRDGCADIVLMSKSLHHLKDPSAVLAQARRILKPQGRFVLFEQVSDGSGVDHSLWDEYHGLRGRVEALKGLYMRPLYAMADIDALLSDSGFSKLRGALVAGDILEDAIAKLGESLRETLASLPEGPQRDDAQASGAATLARMRGAIVRKPDQYAGEWKKECEK